MKLARRPPLSLEVQVKVLAAPITMYDHPLLLQSNLPGHACVGQIISLGSQVTSVTLGLSIGSIVAIYRPVGCMSEYLNVTTNEILTEIPRELQTSLPILSEGQRILVNNGDSGVTSSSFLYEVGQALIQLALKHKLRISSTVQNSMQSRLVGSNVNYIDVNDTSLYYSDYLGGFDAIFDGHVPTKNFSTISQRHHRKLFKSLKEGGHLIIYGIMTTRVIDNLEKSLKRSRKDSFNTGVPIKEPSLNIQTQGHSSTLNEPINNPHNVNSNLHPQSEQYKHSPTSKELSMETAKTLA
ncbi:hypothetical protein O9G_003122 [Rozella allomycis CSF55]|uniref:Uncharacterized protein n=1 Tax=Rozella allomycis (strain CSF55) TaxID=988480 RepID=A0A075AS90_ROZAC|nr:hypothetical protein O9G_003122 [Rozella allomycis CSF55]|eukprot:EPZ33126.1 hypothetical protein O9G_003122 [Rozella allomycis CSF55]